MKYEVQWQCHKCGSEFDRATLWAKERAKCEKYMPIEVNVLRNVSA